MKTLVSPNERLLEQYLWYAGKENMFEFASLRPTAFMVREACDNGELVFNTFTGELILLEPNEAEAVFTLDGAESAGMTGLKRALSSRAFLIPKSFDEFGFIDELRFISELKNKRGDFRNKYYIYTTTGCNARCYYCFEEGVYARSMSRETALKTADYIIDNSGGHRLFLTWFGGEPLYNSEVIDIICERLQSSGCEFESIIKSNGYLFEKERIALYKQKYRLSFVQIPLDGIEGAYNSTKAYIDVPEGIDPYLRVIDNILALLENGVKVDIRLNIGPNNVQDLSPILFELKSRFSSFANFAVYPQVLNEGASNAFSIDERRRLFEAQKNAYVYCLENGIKLARGRYSLPVFKLHSCLADDPCAAGILPEGLLCKCPENPNTTHIFGNVFEAAGNESSAEKAVFYEKHDWKSCRLCPFYPNCVNLRLCAARGRECDEFHRDFRLWKVRRIMREIAENAYSIGLSSSM